MKGFLWKMRQAVQKFMIGRHGPDQFSQSLLYFAIILNIIAMFATSGALSLIAMAAYVFCIFRMLSKNNVARYKENAWFLKTFGQIPSKVKQFIARAKNMRKFVYFECPQCKSKLRVPRGVGNVSVTCGKCGNVIHKKA